MYRGLGALLDPDVRFSRFKPQFATDFDPRWKVALYNGLGVGNFGAVKRPFSARGPMPFTLLGGSIINSGDGACLQFNTTAGQGGGAVSLLADAKLGLNTSEGTMIVTFRATTASNAPAINNSFGIALQQYVGGTWQVACCTDSSGSIYWGWYNNGTETRVNLSDVGLWANNDLVLTGFSYSASGTRAFINGKLVASSGTAASTFNTLTTGGGLNWGIGCDPNPSAGNSRFGHKILDAIVLDRALTDAEWGYVGKNPLVWPFEPNASLNPGLISAVSGAGLSGISQTAAWIM